MNFIHLLFKRNKILDHKDVYHPWFTKTWNEKENREIVVSLIGISIFLVIMIGYMSMVKK